MTLKDIAKQLTTAVQTVPNLVQILRDGLEQATAGSSVEVTQVVSSGTKIASVKVDNETTDLYAPDAVGGIDYGETEQDTGLKWIDGSAIYQKTIDFGALPNTTIKREAHGISNLNTVINLIGMAKGSTSQLPIMLTNDTTAGQITVLVDNTNIEVWAGSDRSSYNAYITLQYTKS